MERLRRKMERRDRAKLAMPVTAATLALARVDINGCVAVGAREARQDDTGIVGSDYPSVPTAGIMVERSVLGGDQLAASMAPETAGDDGDLLRLPGETKSIGNGPTSKADAAADNSSSNNNSVTPTVTSPPATPSENVDLSRNNTATSSTTTATTIPAVSSSSMTAKTSSLTTVANVPKTAGIPPVDVASPPSPQGRPKSSVAFYPAGDSSALCGGAPTGGMVFNDVLKALLTSTVVTADGSRVLAPTFPGISAQHELKYCGPMEAPQASALSRAISMR